MKCIPGTIFATLLIVGPQQVAFSQNSMPKGNWAYKDGVSDDDLKFVALLPKIQTLDFNGDNGYRGAPICTDRCADHLRSRSRQTTSLPKASSISIT